MGRIERAVIDTNVLISAALSANSAPARLLRILGEYHSVLLFSQETLSELSTRLMRAKFDRYVSIELRRRFLIQLVPISETVTIQRTPMGCRDPHDDIFLETATVGRADCLISGDRDLLAMHPYQDLPILSPAEALSQLRASR